MRLLLIILLINLAFSNEIKDINKTKENNETNNTVKSDKNTKTLKQIEHFLSENVLLTQYENYSQYKNLIEEEEKTGTLYDFYSKRKDTKSKKQATILKEKLDDLEKQINLLKQFQNSPIEQILKAPELEDHDNITNPLMIISGFSYIKQILNQKKEYENRVKELDTILDFLEKKAQFLTNIDQKEQTQSMKDEIKHINSIIKDFKESKKISKTTSLVYNQKINENVLKIKEEIKEQAYKAINIFVAILISIAFSWLFKYIAKKTILDNERFYTANKIINFINITLIILILLFAYIENVTYLVTVVGFASAGLAIAMKDMFMSSLGWIVIVFGGSFQVGDRIKVIKNGAVYVGDIIDISFLRITIFEDITLTSYMENRRTGRVIFIPNNYIFTDLISNYTHMSIKTVWDGIDINITFDSNHKKAVYLIKNLTDRLSKGYTDIARKQMNKLRNKYSLKNANVEPRIYTFIEPYGIRISSWYMTNSYAALALRSTLSSEIIDAINKEDDIIIAYPSQSIYIQTKNSTKILQEENEKDIL